jgi:hypothetical protein
MIKGEPNPENKDNGLVSQVLLATDDEGVGAMNML